MSFTTHRASTSEDLGPSTMAEIERARNLFRQHPETYLANTFESPDRGGTSVFVWGPVALFNLPAAPWSVAQVVALARGFGMSEVRSLTTFKDDYSAPSIVRYFEPDARLAFVDDARQLAVIVICNFVFTVADREGGSTNRTPAQAAEWLVRAYCDRCTDEHGAKSFKF